MLKKMSVEVIVALFIVLWIYTGMDKLLEGAAFRAQLESSTFMQGIASFIAFVLPYGELLLATLLIIKSTRKFALYLSFGLMLFFTGYVWLMLNFAYDLPCSCGGIVSKLSWMEHLWFNAIFTLLAVIALFIETNLLLHIKRKEVLT